MGTDVRRLDAKRWIGEYQARVEQALGSPVQVILFGSYARGEATPDSDVDLLVVVPQLDRQILNTILDIAWEVSFEAGLVLTVIPVALDELEKLSDSPFLQAVRREGIRI